MVSPAIEYTFFFMLLCINVLGLPLFSLLFGWSWSCDIKKRLGSLKTEGECVFDETDALKRER